MITVRTKEEKSSLENPVKISVININLVAPLMSVMLHVSELLFFYVFATDKIHKQELVHSK